MPSCEICGRIIKGRGREMTVEGVSLIVCSTCASRIQPQDSPESPNPRSTHVHQRPRRVDMRRGPRPRHALTSGSVRPRPRPKPRPVTLDDMVLVENYADIIRRARQASGMTQEELAQRIGEKFSTMQAIEAGRLKPTKKAIRGLERELRISLLEPITPVPIKTVKDLESRGPTLGDVVRVKRKKRN